MKITINMWIEAQNDCRLQLSQVLKRHLFVFLKNTQVSIGKKAWGLGQGWVTATFHFELFCNLFSF